MAGRDQFRQSQGVVPFGVGAIVDFSDESLMTAGLDAWPYEIHDGESRAAIATSTQIVDGRLARRLSGELGRRIEFFLSPAEAPEFGIGKPRKPGTDFMPFVRFPNWHFCPRCRVMARIPWNAPTRDKTLRCSNPHRRIEGDGKTCAELYPSRRPHLAPVRFVAACENGHIMDFPWHAWAHLNGDQTCGAAPNELYIYSTPAAGLAGVVIQCRKCKSRNSMARAFSRDVLRECFGSECPGERPWLGPNAGVNGCQHVPQTIQRGASNAYFADVSSSILIPPYSSYVQQVLDRPDVWSEIEALPIVNGRVHVNSLQAKARNFGIDPDVFVRAVEERIQGKSAENEETGLVDENRYRHDEYAAYLGSRPPRQERRDFDKEIFEVDLYADWFKNYFDRVVQVTKLRETRVLTGFTRLVPPEANDCSPAALSREPKNWLPAFEVRGEGIFLVFSDASVEAWKKNDAIQTRVRELNKRLARVRQNRNLEPRIIDPKLLLIHTFSHLLIRQLAFESGYDASSLRERLYVSSDEATPMHGVLIYTASGDSEGSLGGLVREAEPGRLEQTVRAALINASICSSDPLCIDSNGQGVSSLNLAACHACGLLPETSCEEGNLLLDRGAVVGTPSYPEMGYFHELSAGKQ
ncbi:MAG: DUF1998 domain-containing protein [Alphaproteobacteria bacterium]